MSHLRTLPFDATPDLELAHVRAWLIRPMGAATWMAPGSRFDMAAADLMARDLTDMLFNQYGQQGPFLFVHDWSGSTSYDHAARGAMINWALRFSRSQINAIRIRISEDTPTLVRMSISAGIKAVKMAGYRVDLVNRLHETLDEFDAQPLERTAPD